MNINATLLGQMLVFGVLIWFSWKFIWPPLTKAVEDRQKKIAEGLAAAERGQKELQHAFGDCFAHGKVRHYRDSRSSQQRSAHGGDAVQPECGLKIQRLGFAVVRERDGVFDEEM